ncbi:hypothetical protein HU200_016038 [Digitaria exilis]|uniref:Uncharacterized protein n=1 Tax=Digitaria exilis TaxID=1010633 RepID=A0A835FA18_9POAL|nr:hypothetical protein HU200_016038 [Digitaria exilis]
MRRMKSELQLQRQLQVQLNKDFRNCQEHNALKGFFHAKITSVGAVSVVVLNNVSLHRLSAAMPVDNTV